MLTMTEAAGDHLADVLADAPGEAVVRITAQDRSLTPRLDRQREDDVTFQHGGRTVLVIAPQLAEFLTDRMFDAEDTESGNRLILRVQRSSDETRKTQPEQPTI